MFWFCWQLGHLTLEDYQIWSVKSALANEFLNLLFQVSTPYTAASTFVSVRIQCFVYLCVCLHAGLPHSPGPQAWHSWGGGPNHQVRSYPPDLLLYYVLEYVVWPKICYCWCVRVCRGWLERESRHGLQQGQNWFLISMLWWQQWKDYVKYVSHVEELYILQTLRW